MKRSCQLFLFSLVASPFGCAETTDTTVADSAQPVAESEVFDACIDYCRRVAACDESIDETVCADACGSIADQAMNEHCEAPLHAALDCIDRHFCQSGYPNTKEVGASTRTPCQVKAAAVSCVLSTPPELEPAFGFFGTGLGTSAFRGFGFSNDDASCAFGARASNLDGWFEIRCGPVDEHYVCSCLIDDRVTATFETEVKACPMNERTDLATLHRSCDWHF